MAVGGSNGVDQKTMLGLHLRYDDADREVREAVSRRKSLRGEIRGMGVNLHGFDRARKDREKTGEKRREEQLEYLRQMAWLGQPVPMGGQAEFSFDPKVFSEHELKVIENDGYEAGKGGRRRDSNKYNPGDVAHQQWDSGWLRGQAEIAAKMGPENGAASAKKPGRPPGSKNKNKGSASGTPPSQLMQ